MVFHLVLGILLSKNLVFAFLHPAWKVSKYGVFLVRIFPHSDWIRRDTSYLSVFSPNAGKYELEKNSVFGQFSLSGLDRKWKGAGPLLNFCEDIPSRFLNSGSTCNAETIPVEICLRKRKYLLNCCYNLHKGLI